MNAPESIHSGEVFLRLIWSPEAFDEQTGELIPTAINKGEFDGRKQSGFSVNRESYSEVSDLHLIVAQQQKKGSATRAVVRFGRISVSDLAAKQTVGGRFTSKVLYWKSDTDDAPHYHAIVFVHPSAFEGLSNKESDILLRDIRLIVFELMRGSVSALPPYAPLLNLSSPITSST